MKNKRIHLILLIAAIITINILVTYGYKRCNINNSNDSNSSKTDNILHGVEYPQYNIEEQKALVKNFYSFDK